MKDFFLKKINKFSNQIALITNKKEHTYEDIIKNSKILSKNLVSRKLVLILSDNSYQFILGYIAFANKGLILQIINKDTEFPVFLKLVENYKPDYIYGPENFFYKKFKNYKKLRSFKKFNLYQYTIELRKKYSKDLFLLLTTSGSTGSQKFVMLSYVNIQKNIQEIARYLKLNKSSRSITTMHPSYSYGLSIINSHLFVGGSIVLSDKSITQKQFWDLFNNHKVNNFGGVPFIFEILKNIGFHNMNLNNIKHIHQAGGMMDYKLINYFYEIYKISFYLMYGQTEASPRISYHLIKSKLLKNGCIGKPLKNINIILKDDQNVTITKKNIIGEINLKGPNIFLGYAKDYKDLNKCIKKDILTTGDLAYLDTSNYYYIVSRKTRFAKLFGKRVSLDELENVLHENFNIKFICISKNDDRISIYTQSKIHVKQYLIEISKLMKINHSNIELIYVKELPRKSNGKIDYQELKNYIL